MRLKLLSLLFFVFSSSIFAQPPHTFTTPGPDTFKVPAGVTLLNVECWGAGGAGGGVTGSLTGGGGGGGAAYSKVILTVTSATTLNYKVGAGGIGGSGANGGNGESTNFSSITANGGAGGEKGSSGNGGPAGSASGSGTIWSGGSGQNSAVVFGAVTSGRGGGAAGTISNGSSGASGGAGGATGGGAGGAPVSILSDGNAGNSPGGGGSGAAALISFGTQKGGNGGNGKIIVNYTCPTYGLTSSTTAPDVCTTIGTTSTVTLTGGASLPNGDYVVTYNRSNPTATGLTATMTVNGGSGIGIFTASGLNTPGSSTITVTSLASESCTTNISANIYKSVTINVYSASVAGSINTPAAICSGGTGGLLTLSGFTGTILGWESSVSPFSSWSPISNTTATHSPGVLTQTTQFRAIVKNGACSQITSLSTTITVNPLPVFTTSGTLNDICFDAGVQTATLPYSATTNTPINYSIVWNAAANAAGLVNQGTTPFTFLSGGGNLNTIIVPAGVNSSTYFGTITIVNANCSASVPIQLTIKPKPTPPIPFTITDPTCAIQTGSVLLTGLPMAVTWVIKQNGTVSATYTNTGTTYTVSGLVPGNYTFTVEYTGSCSSASSANVLINGLITNTYTGVWSNGSPTINQNLVFSGNYSSAGGGAGNISGCSCTLNPGINVLINSNDTVTISNAVINNGGTLTFENNASLLQTTNAINLGNIIYKRISEPMKNFDFTYWSSPVTGQTLYNLSPNTLSDKYFSYTGSSWKQEVPSTTVMVTGKGYIIRTPKAGLWGNGENVIFPYAQSVQFVGTPNNGNIPGESLTAGNFYLIGNPYPSALNADAFLYSNLNNSAILEGTIYLWTHHTPIQQVGSPYVYSSSDYATYNGVGGVATLPAYIGGIVPSGKIAAGQSFFALAKASGSIEFNNAMRVAGTNNQFFKPEKTSKSALLEKHRLWLNMTNTEGAFKQTLIGYIEGATNGLDSDFDGVTLDGNPYVDFYSINSESNLVIQGRILPFSDKDEVELGYRSNITGNFIISIDHADGLLANQAVFLEDKLTHNFHDLRQSDYIFSTVSGTFKNRFVLKYTNPSLTVNDYGNYDNVQVWIDKEKIKINSSVEDIDKISIYDLSGKQLYRNINVDEKQFNIDSLLFSDQIIIVKIFLAENMVITKKVILINSD